MPLWLWGLIGLPRIFVLWAVWHNPAYIQAPDSASYLEIAQNLRAHHHFSRQTSQGEVPEMSRTPGYPAFLGLLDIAGQGSLIAIAALQSLLSVLTLWLAWIWLARLCQSEGAIPAVAVLATDLVSLLHTPMVLAETLFSAAIVVALLWSSKAIAENKMKDLLIAGVLWGAACLIKPIIVFWPILLSLLWFRNRKAWALFLACAYLGPSLWVVRNYTVAHYAGFSAQGGGDLLKGPAAAVEAMLHHESWGSAREQLMARVNQNYPAGFSSEAEQSRIYGHAAAVILRQHPILVLRWCLTGTWRILFGPGLDMVPDLLGLPRNTTQLNVGVSGAGTLGLLRAYPFLTPLLALSMGELVLLYFCFAIGCRRLWRQGRGRELFLILGGCLYFLLISNHQGYYRYRIPMMPFLAAGMAVGLSRPKEPRADRRDPAL